MSARRAVAQMLSGPGEWNRRRLQLLLGVAVVVAAAVVAGLVWSVIELVRGGTAAPAPQASNPAASIDESPAAAVGGLNKAQPGPLSTASVGTIRLPQPSTMGASQVGTGLPDTSAGAMAQLIAIDQRAIGSGSVVTAQDVITAWAAPGGPTASSWSGVLAVQTLLESAGLPADGSAEMTIGLDPEMGLVRDHTAEATTVCIDFVMSATIRDGDPTQVAVADCQHMSWLRGRWVIGPGREAAPTASLWPGTQASYDAGYEWVEVQP